MKLSFLEDKTCQVKNISFFGKVCENETDYLNNNLAGNKKAPSLKLYKTGMRPSIQIGVTYLKYITYKVFLSKLKVRKSLIISL